MPVTFNAPDNPAPLFGKRRDRVSTSTFWKCQIGWRVHLARESFARRSKYYLSRDDFATLLGISSKRLWEIENGIIPIEASEIAFIAETLGVHPGSFFDEASFDFWVTGAVSRSPAWILAQTIGQLSNSDRNLVEQLIIRLDAKSEDRSP